MDERREPAREAAAAAAVRMRLPAAGGLDGGLVAPPRPLRGVSASAHSGAAPSADPPPPGRGRRAGGPRRAEWAEERTERRLAALAFLDVAGYSRLMGADEAATLHRWLALRDGVVEPLVAGWRGRVVDRAGDGLFLEFRSVLDAVRWAFDVQAAMAAAPAAVAEAPPLLVRVAVHLGDVLGAADGGVHGDAVNVAARLQEHAAPGGVVVSGAVHEQVRHALFYAAEDLGPLALKNIGRPVHGLRVGPAAPRRRGPTPAAGNRTAPSVVVVAAAVLLAALVASLAAAGASGGRTGSAAVPRPAAPAPVFVG